MYASNAFFLRPGGERMHSHHHRDPNYVSTNIEQKQVECKHFLEVWKFRGLEVWKVGRKSHAIRTQNSWSRTRAIAYITRTIVRALCERVGKTARNPRGFAVNLQGFHIVPPGVSYRNSGGFFWPLFQNENRLPYKQEKSYSLQSAKMTHPKSKHKFTPPTLQTSNLPNLQTSGDSQLTRGRIYLQWKIKRRILWVSFGDVVRMWVHQF